MESYRCVFYVQMDSDWLLLGRRLGVFWKNAALQDQECKIGTNSVKNRKCRMKANDFIKVKTNCWNVPNMKTHRVLPAKQCCKLVNYILVLTTFRRFSTFSFTSNQCYVGPLKKYFRLILRWEIAPPTQHKTWTASLYGLWISLSISIVHFS